MCNGTAQNFCPKHLRQRDVLGINRGAANFFFALYAWAGNADASNLVHVRSPHPLLNYNETKPLRKFVNGSFVVGHLLLLHRFCLCSNTIYDLW
jgi:hypothetical protein